LKLVTDRSIKVAQQMAMGVSEGAMNSLITITRPSEGGFNDETRKYVPPTGEPFYGTEAEGKPAGITPTEGPITMDLGDEPTYYSSISWKIPHKSPLPRVNDVIKITANVDEDLVNRQFRITNVQVGGRIVASTSGQAQGIAPSKGWVSP